MTLPGTRLRACAARLFSAATMERLVDAAIADFQAEYASALQQGSRLRRAWVLAAGYVCFWKTLCAYAAEFVAERAYAWMSANRWAIGQMMSSMAVVTAVTALVYVLPFVHMYWHRAASPLWWLALCLVPQALAGATPPGLLFGSLWSLRTRAASSGVRTTILLVAICATLVTFANVGWITPRANDAYRHAIFGSNAFRGMNELTFPEVNTAFREITEITDPEDVRLLRLSFHARLALVLAPLFFGWLACAALARLRRQARSATVILIGFALYVSYCLAPDWTHLVATGTAPPALIAWVPNGLAVLFTLALVVIKRGEDAPQPSRA